MINELNLQNYFYGLSVLLLLIVIWQTVRLSKLDRIRKEFFSSELKKDLEQILIDQNRAISTINKNLKQHEKSLEDILNDNRNNFQKIGFVRFNPFDDSGGNVSFALAILNDHNDGFVLSSLHGREGTRVYAKVVKSNMSESKLTDEELKAIKLAK
jgi:hypothetical protein